jgi:hypothetical protein
LGREGNVGGVRAEGKSEGDWGSTKEGRGKAGGRGPVTVIDLYRDTEGAVKHATMVEDI